MRKFMTFQSLLPLIFITAISCTSHSNKVKATLPTSARTFFLDIVKDNQLDTLVIESFKNRNDLKIIKLKNENKYNNICIVKLRDDKSVLILENQHIGKIKQLRLIDKNTSFIPDYYYLNIKFDKIWQAEDLGFMNTNPNGKLESCISSFYSGVKIKELGEEDRKNREIILDIAKIVSRSDPKKFQCN